MTQNTITDRQLHGGADDAPGWQVVDWDAQVMVTGEQGQVYAGVVAAPGAPMVLAWLRLRPGEWVAPHAHPCWTFVSSLERDAVTLVGHDLVPVRHRAGQTLVLEPFVVHAAVNPSRRHAVSVVEARSEATLNDGLVVLADLADEAAAAAVAFQRRYIEPVNDSITVQDLLR
jgi:uncharacterized RmlC-like cupin family protein